MLGTIISDKYELLEELGRGRLGIVYRAVEKSDGAYIAIKILKQLNERDVQRFQREARAAKKLNHPNVVRVHDLGSTADGAPYIVMELVDGTSLRRLIRQLGHLPADRCIRIFVQVAEALAHLHENGVIHRDLKPANIMLVDQNGQPDIVKLVDFGLAMPTDPAQAREEKVTLDGYVTGTPAYMSPEQCVAGHVDTRSDIYSFGCVMFRAITGIAPIAGNTARDTMTNQISQQPTAFSRVAANIQIAPELQTIVLKCLEKKPEDRYQKAEDLKADLIGLQ